jgi:hypothetical protein
MVGSSSLPRVGTRPPSSSVSGLCGNIGVDACFVPWIIPLSSLARELLVHHGDSTFFWSSLVDIIFVLDGEVGKGSVLVECSVVGIPISSCPISSSCPPASMSFLEISS